MKAVLWLCLAALATGDHPCLTKKGRFDRDCSDETSLCKKDGGCASKEYCDDHEGRCCKGDDCYYTCGYEKCLKHIHGAGCDSDGNQCKVLCYDFAQDPPFAYCDNAKGCSMTRKGGCGSGDEKNSCKGHICNENLCEAQTLKMEYFDVYCPPSETAYCEDIDIKKECWIKCEKYKGKMIGTYCPASKGDCVETAERGCGDGSDPFHYFPYSCYNSDGYGRFCLGARKLCKLDGGCATEEFCKKNPDRCCEGNGCNCIKFKGENCATTKLQSEPGRKPTEAVTTEQTNAPTTVAKTTTGAADTIATAATTKITTTTVTTTDAATTSTPPTTSATIAKTTTTTATLETTEQVETSTSTTTTATTSTATTTTSTTKQDEITDTPDETKTEKTITSAPDETTKQGETAEITATTTTSTTKQDETAEVTVTTTTSTTKQDETANITTTTTTATTKQDETAEITATTTTSTTKQDQITDTPDKTKTDKINTDAPEGTTKQGKTADNSTTTAASAPNKDTTKSADPCTKPILALFIISLFSTLLSLFN